MSKKDIVYVDAEDDITALIDRVVSSKSKIVALVLPKRFSVLQSIVNMKLLKRSAEEAKKQAVLITNEASLLPLAGTVGLYVSDSLKTRPEIPDAGAKVEIDDSVIEDDGKELDLNTPIGELDGDSIEVENTQEPIKEVSGSRMGELKDKALSAAAAIPVLGAKLKKSDEAPKSPLSNHEAIAVPNFQRFRNRIILACLGLGLLLAAWVMAFIILPSATIDIKAQTRTIPSELAVIVEATGEVLETEVPQLTSELKQIQRTVSESFPATGEKDVGTRASGILSLDNCFASSSVSIPAGTTVTDNTAGLTFTTTAAVTVAGAEFKNGCVQPGRADVPIEATTAGDEKNLSPRSYTIEGFQSMVAVGSQMSGGTTQIVKVISPADVEEASKRLLDRDASTVRSELTAQFGEDFFVVHESFTATAGDVVTEPAVDTEVEEGTVTAQYTYTLVGIQKAAIDNLLAVDQTAKIDDAQESILDSGYDALVAVIDNQVSATRLNLTLSTQALAGPEIDIAALAEEISGKRFSDVESILRSKPGVREVDVNFSPFWVANAPKASKINIQVEVAAQE